jgi:hypothetical protein
MGREKKIEIDGEEIAVRELTVGDLENLFAAGSDKKTAGKGIEIIADAITGGVTGTKKLLALCTSLEEAEIDKLGVNAYSLLVAAMKELNADFFEIYRRDLTELGKLMAAVPIPPGNSVALKP